MTDIEADFEEWWKAYPKRIGGNPKKPALEQYRLKRKRGHSAEEMLRGAKALSKQHPEASQYVPHARTYLFQERYKDAPPPEPTLVVPPPRSPREPPPEIGEAERARVAKGMAALSASVARSMNPRINPSDERRGRELASVRERVKRDIRRRQKASGEAV